MNDAWKSLHTFDTEGFSRLFHVPLFWHATSFCGHCPMQSTDGLEEGLVMQWYVVTNPSTLTLDLYMINLPLQKLREPHHPRRLS